MLKLSVCTETVYCHEDFNNRIEKISKIGINTIEFWQWSNKDLKEVHNKLQQNNVNLLGFCIDSENSDISKFISDTALNTDSTDKLLTAVHESIDAADCPGRGEPGTGNIDYSGIFNMLVKEKYDKYVGLEFFPKNPEHRRRNIL